MRQIWIEPQRYECGLIDGNLVTWAIVVDAWAPPHPPRQATRALELYTASLQRTVHISLLRPVHSRSFCYSGEIVVAPLAAFLAWGPLPCRGRLNDWNLSLDITRVSLPCSIALKQRPCGLNCGTRVVGDVALEKVFCEILGLVM